ncbi:hypothetical protein Mgra_00008594 [Meloidogyne graminicola]|uniref:Uncharacterized protein n=1 Tax=Meloidogyne graminicola TaxID=189291 RepID=A0A8S9ZFB4_9BILA|nr:hypothetical protein Mgra_00008594 [Meloidogyne graminicola]
MRFLFLIFSIFGLSMMKLLVQANDLNINPTKAVGTQIDKIEINPFITGGILNRIDNILLDIKCKTGFWFIFTNYLREFFGGTNLKKIFDVMIRDFLSLKEGLINNPLSFENVSVELRELEAIALNKVETISSLDLKIKEIIKEKHINGILNLIKRTIDESRHNLLKMYIEIKSKNMENLPYYFKRGYLSLILKSKSFEELPLINQSEQEMAEWSLRSKEEQGKYEVNAVISIIESGIGAGMSMFHPQSKGLIYAFNKNVSLRIHICYLSNNVKQFEQIYLYSLFMRVISKFYYVLNGIVSAQILEVGSFPDAVELLYLWILRSEIIVPFMERINANTKIYGDNEDQKTVNKLLSQTLHVFWELDKRYIIEDRIRSLKDSFTHEVVLSKIMELPQAYFVQSSNGALFYQIHISSKNYLQDKLKRL